MSLKIYELENKLFDCIDNSYDSFTNSQIVKITFLVQLLKSDNISFDVECIANSIKIQINSEIPDSLSRKIDSLGFDMVDGGIVINGKK